MDGNDLNPIVNTNGPMMQGPDPRPMPTGAYGAPTGAAGMPNAQANAPAGTPAMPPVVQAGAAGQVAGQAAVANPAGAATDPAAQATMPNTAPGMTPTLATMGTAEALNTQIASDGNGEISRETKNKIQKIVALVLVAVCTGFAVLALAIVVLANVPRIATLENQIDGLIAQNETMKDQITALNRRIGYDIDVTFFDGGMPGTTYTVTLQPETREVIVATYAGCSLTDIAGCDQEPEIATTLLGVNEYDLVAQAYNTMDGSAMNYTKNMLAWTNAILALIGGDTAIADTGSHDWEIIKIYDTNGDGMVSSREYGAYLLAQMIK